MDFTDKVYNITIQFPPEEKFGLVDQFRRASVSIPLNIAEGSGGTRSEFSYFLKVARRSVRECIAIAEISFRQRYIGQDVRDQLRADCGDLSRMINGLLKSVSPNAEQRTQNK